MIIKMKKSGLIYKVVGVALYWAIAFARARAKLLNDVFLRVGANPLRESRLKLALPIDRFMKLFKTGYCFLFVALPVSLLAAKRPNIVFVQTIALTS